MNKRGLLPLQALGSLAEDDSVSLACTMPRLRRAAMGLAVAVLLSGCGRQPAPDTGLVATLPRDADAPPVTAQRETPLHHAQTCAQYLGPIPAVSCSDAELMPITVDGEEVEDTPQSCDRPSALTGTCETGERIAARYEGTHHDGSPRPEVVFVNFCRDGGMGLIGHNEETGATCFFHIKLEHDNSGQFPGSKDPNYDDYWEPPEVVAQDNCQSCHQADPWLHSPWIDQLRDPRDASQTLVPVTASPDAPYIVVGEQFEQPIHAGAPDNACTSCHRPQCDTFFVEPLGDLEMPGPFADTTWAEGSSADAEALRDWCDSLPSPHRACSTGPLPPGTLALLLALVGLRRRSRSTSPR